MPRRKKSQYHDNTECHICFKLCKSERGLTQHFYTHQPSNRSSVRRLFKFLLNDIQIGDIPTPPDIANISHVSRTLLLSSSLPDIMISAKHDDSNLSISQVSERIPANEERQVDKSPDLSDSNYIPVSIEERVHKSLEISENLSDFSEFNEGHFQLW